MNHFGKLSRHCWTYSAASSVARHGMHMGLYVCSIRCAYVCVMLRFTCIYLGNLGQLNNPTATNYTISCESVPRHNWSVSEGQAVMKEAQAWGLLGWDALHGLSAPWREDVEDGWPR